jgi:hypothetical protein
MHRTQCACDDGPNFSAESMALLERKEVEQTRMLAAI